jgi:hypothetical protein
MSPPKRSNALLDALRFLVTSSTPAQHKRVLINVVVEAMRADAEAQRDLEAKQKVDAGWHTDEVDIVRGLLQGKVAHSWQEADEVLMQLATQLKRQPANVHSKALELNLGPAVDYRLARAQLSSKAQP